MGGTAIGSPILGWVAETMGPRWAVIGGGTATTGAILGCMTELTEARTKSLKARYEVE